MRKADIFLVILLAGTPYLVSAQAQAKYDMPIARFEVRGIPTLEAIAELGRESGAPIGVVRSVDDRLCSTNADFSAAGRSAAEILPALTHGLRGYTAAVADGVLTVEPEGVKPSTRRLSLAHDMSG